MQTDEKILCGNFDKKFSRMEKKALRNIVRHFLHANVFMFTLFISNDIVFLVQFRINLHL